jgi:hypothetical protein
MQLSRCLSIAFDRYHYVYRSHSIAFDRFRCLSIASDVYHWFC